MKLQEPRDVRDFAVDHRLVKAGQPLFAFWTGADMCADALKTTGIVVKHVPVIKRLFSTGMNILATLFH